MKLKLNNKSLWLLVFSSAFFFDSQIATEASRAEPYISPYVRTGFVDKDVPSTIKLKSAVDGLPAGTVLYRHRHVDIDYYSPIVPDSIKGSKFDVSEGKYQTWGPWNMSVNKDNQTMHTRQTYTSAITTDKVTVYTNESATKTSSHKNIGTLSKDTTLNVLSHRTTNNYLFFDLSPFPTLLSKSTTGVGMIKLGDGGVKLSGQKFVLHDGWENNVLLKNFKKLAKYKNNTSSNYVGIEDGRYTNPDYATGGVAGLSGEWRYLGYNAKGEPLNNPYFLADDLYYTGNSPMWAYPWRLTPWTTSGKIESDETKVSEAYASFSEGKSSFPYDGGAYDSHKKDIVKRLHAMGELKPTYPTDSEVMDMVNRLSLETHPTKQGIILNGQNKKATHNRVAFLPNYNMRDLYMSKISIVDDNTGAVVATGTANRNGGKSYITGTVYKNRSYTARVVIANGAESELLATSLKAQLGYTYNETSLNSNMAIGGVKNLEEILIGDKGGLTKTLGSESEVFEFKFAVTSNQSGHIDIYGFVGDEHQGVDNLIYTNDVAYTRVYISSNNPPNTGGGGGSNDNTCEISSDGKTKTCGQLDIEVYAIQIKDPSGNEVYREIYGNTPEKKFAPIPGNDYYIEYTAKLDGEHIMEYKWVDAVNDNPNTPQNEYVAGHWDSGSLKKYNNIMLNYYVTKYSGGINDEDKTVKNSAGPMYNVDFTTTNIPGESGYFIKFKTDVMTFQHPYVNTAFRVLSPDSRLNSNTENDRMETTINDSYDIKMTNFYFYPSIAIIENGQTKINYLVSYDLELSVPSYVGVGDYQVMIDTAIEINEQTFYVEDYLTVGQNKHITHDIKNVIIESDNGGNIFFGGAVANSSKTVYESNFSNNSASDFMFAAELPSPNLGKPTDTVKAPDSLNSNNPNKGGDAFNNCLTPRTKNTWTTTHRETSWTASTINYSTFDDTKNISFKKYSTTSDNANAATYTYEETFNIDKILFRSKYTKDKKYGDNGWVDLLSSDEKEREKAIIKAGYGFELKVVTKYNTDAFTKKNWNISNNSSSGKVVSNLPGTPNYGLQDIFLELPGTKATRKILSSTGYGDTTIGLNMTKNINTTTNNGEWTYTIKPTNTLGVGSEPKIYIPSETKDGDYTLKIYTPSVSGTGAFKETYSSMCDRKEVTIKVKGSATDDLNSHETQ